ncbi:MAG: protein BatD [Candidatus Omnitrophica bacterium]|nr:protein BatD [Candidatus Omnitrophota bacterium]
MVRNKGIRDTGCGMRVTGFILCLVTMGSVLPSAWAALQVRAMVDSSRISLDDQLRYTIEISGGGRNVTRPSPPELDSFTIYSAGSSTNISIVNGQMRSSARFTFVMVPHAPGVFTIPSVEVQANGSVYKTDPITVEVLDGGVAPAPPRTGPAPPRTPPQTPARPPAAGPAVPQPPELNEFEYERGDIFIRAWVDKPEAYVNEQVLLTYTVYTRLEASIREFAEDPKFTGFWQEEFPPEKKLKTERVRIQGRDFVKADVRRVALFPTKSGTLAIDPGILVAQVSVRERDPFFDEFFNDSFFAGWGRTLTRSVERRLATRPISVEVKDFPQEGKPEHFTGAVGDFDITAHIDTQEVEENEPVTLKLKVFGEGNVQTVQEPKWARLEGFKYYDSGTTTDVNTFEQSVIGEKAYEKVLIPQKEGSYEIPPFEFAYFDPASGTYRNKKTGGFALKVKPGPVEEQVSAAARTQGSQQEIELLGMDIQYIRQDLGRLRPKTAPLYERPFYLWIHALPVLAYLGVLVWTRRRERLGRNPALARLERARRMSDRHLGTARRALERGDGVGFYGAVSQAIRQYIGDKLNLPIAGLSVDTVLGHMRVKGFEEETVELLKECLITCDTGRYASLTASPQDMDETLKTARHILRALEKKL